MSTTMKTLLICLVFVSVSCAAPGDEPAQEGNKGLEHDTSTMATSSSGTDMASVPATTTTATPTPGSPDGMNTTAATGTLPVPTETGTRP